MGIDLGTTSIKSVIFNQKGKRIASGTCEYRQIIDASDRTVELDTADLWSTFVLSIREALKSFRSPASEIISLAVTDQGDTFVPLDEEYRPIGNAITYLDARSQKESETVTRDLGIDRVFAVTGQPFVSTSYPATKILWIRDNNPQLFRRTKLFAPIEDYLVYKLTNVMVCDYSGASMTLMFDIQKKKWWHEILHYLQIDEDQLPELRAPGTPIRDIVQEASKKTGLSSSTTVATGAHDHTAAAIGAGNIKPGIVTESTGAVLGLTTTVDKPFFDRKKTILCNCHAVENKYLLLLVGKTGGMVLRWFRDEFCQSEMNEAKDKKIEAYDILSYKASKISPGSDKLIILPHLMGAGTPENNPKARGVFFGLTLGHTKAHVARAIMESVAFMLRRDVELLIDEGMRLEEIRSIGGGARSTLWNQIKADVTQRKVVTPEVEESASLGVGILAGMSAKMFSSIDDACGTMVHMGGSYVPNQENGKVYNDQFGRYIDLYEHLKDLF